MLRACVLDYGDGWFRYLPLVEFAYNKSYQASIDMAPYKAIYGRRCRSPICWDDIEECRIIGPDLVEDAKAKVRVAKQRLLAAQRRQKSYVDWHRRDLEFQVGDHALLKVSPARGIKRFILRNKLSPRFVGPFEILERIGTVAYRLALPHGLTGVHNVFHVSMLRKYIRDPSHVINPTIAQLRGDLSNDEAPSRILAHDEKKMRNKTILYVKVQWKNHEKREATWERESGM